MGGRGGTSHRASGGGFFGRDPNLNGYYIPQNLQEAIDRHLVLGSFSQAAWDMLTDAERNSIFSYTGSHYTAMNDVLFGKRAASPHVQSLIDYATRGMDKMSASFDFVATRGDSIRDMASLLGGTVDQLSNPAFLRGRIGKTVEFKGFMSSGVHESAAWTHKGVTTIIKTPKGTKGMYVDPVSANRGEFEFLFQRGARLKVHKITTDSNGQLKTITLEVVPTKKKR